MTPCPHCGHEQEEADGYTLVIIRGRVQKITGDQEIGNRTERGQWLNKIPIYCVEDRATPPKEPTTGTKTG